MKKPQALYALSLLCLNLPLQAELKVIADLGGESAIRFYEPIQPVHTDDAPVHPNAVPAQITEMDMLPVVSKRWSVGKVTPRKLDLIGMNSMFIVGADDTSLKWLIQNREKLASLNAMGLVVNVQTPEQLTRLREAVPEVVMSPVPADELAERMGIFHYPLLVTSEEIRQ